MKIGQAQLLPLAQTATAAAAASPAPVSADHVSVAALGGSPELSCAELSSEQRGLIISGFADGLSAGPPGAAGEVADADEARTEAWLTTLVDAVRADPHALDPVIELAARQLSPSTTDGA